MTGRQLIKEIEACDLDKNIVLIVSVLSEDSDALNLLLREINGVIENKDFIGIQ